jgi:2'-5' RNA ligase
MQRTFIAVKIDPGKEMAGCIQAVQEELKREKIKWVDPGQLHITLHFLGNTSPQQVAAVGKILEKTVPGFACPEVVFGGLGLFRNLRDPRVLWIGMDPGDTLPGVKQALDRELDRIGFPPEDREFKPHLTLARIKFIKNRDALERLLSSYGDTSFQRDRISEIIFYESILRPEGPQYIPLKRVPFKPA